MSGYSDGYSPATGVLDTSFAIEFANGGIVVHNIRNEHYGHSIYIDSNGKIYLTSYS